MTTQPEPHPSETKMRAMIAARTTYQLIADWEESEKQPLSPGLVIVRTFLMDELEKRNPAAFECWLLSNESSPRKFFTGSDEEDSAYTQEYDDFTDADPGL